MKTQSSRQMEAILKSIVLAMKRNSAKHETLLVRLTGSGGGAGLFSV